MATPFRGQIHRTLTMNPLSFKLSLSGGAMTVLVIPNRYLAIAPVIITSPTPRCGTTLVQRLISASDNAFIYGEEVGNQIGVQTTWLMGMLRQFDETGQIMDRDFRRAIDGTLQDWRPGLTAPTEVMRQAWIETFYQIPAALSNYSRSIGRPVWGFKVPSLTRDLLRAMLSMLPKAKIIYVFRNLFDVLKSAKARRFAVTDEEVSRFCAEWVKNMRETSELAQDQRILFLKYEDMLARKAEHLRLLELFVGASNVDSQVFDLKINTFVGEQDQGYSPSQYIEPAELTAKDRALVMSEAGPIISHFYGDQSAA